MREGIPFGYGHSKIKPLDDLTLMDDYMFGVVMSDPENQTSDAKTAEYIKNGELITKDSQRIKTEYAYLTTINAPITMKNGNTVIIKAEVIDIFDDPINTGKVSFSINDQWIGTTNVKNNIATLTYKVNKNPGTYTLKATYIDKNNNKASDTDTQSITIQKADNYLTTTLYLNEEKQIGTDRFRFDYFDYDGQYDKGAYVFLYYHYNYDDIIPYTYRLLEIKVYYKDYSGNIWTKTSKATEPYEFGDLSTNTMVGCTPYKADVKYRKMTESEKRENAKYSIL